jgi:hypothetical protein
MPLRYQWKDLDPTSDGNSPNENTRLLIEKAMAHELPVKKMRAREKQFVGKTAAENSRQKKMDRLMYVLRATCSGRALAGNRQARCDGFRVWTLRVGGLDTSLQISARVVFRCQLWYSYWVFPQRLGRRLKLAGPRRYT